eukprot:1177802-Prorocentrum_minimum.AAC.3
MKQKAAHTTSVSRLRTSARNRAFEGRSARTNACDSWRYLSTIACRSSSWSSDRWHSKPSATAAAKRKRSTPCSASCAAAVSCPGSATLTPLSHHLMASTAAPKELKTLKEVREGGRSRSLMFFQARERQTSSLSVTCLLSAADAGGVRAGTCSNMRPNIQKHEKRNCNINK